MMLETFDDIFQELFDPEEAANLRARSDLMLALERYFRSQGWDETTAAERCGVSVVRIRSLLTSKIDLFTVDDLVNMAGRAGLSIDVTASLRKAA